MYVNEHLSVLQCAKAGRKKKDFPDIVEKLVIIWRFKACLQPATYST